MAPQKPKRPSMLTRQRQLRAQQQQVRNASRNQLPSAGGSSGNSRQARAQRANTTRAQAANNQRIINRGMEGFIRRGQANDKADAAARGTGPSGTTRTAGAGGVLGRPKPSAVTAPNRPASKTSNRPFRGWGNVSDPNSYPSNSTRPRGPSSEQRAADANRSRPATRGGAIEKAGPTIDVKANTAKLSAGSARPGSNARPALPGGRLGELMKDATTGRRGPIGAASGRGLAAEGVIFAAGSNLIDKYGQALGQAIRTERAVRMSSDGGRYVPGDQQRPTPAPAPAKPKSKPPTRRPAPTQSGSASTPSRGSSSSGSAPRSMPRAVTRSSGPAPDAGMKNQDKNFRGNLFEKTFGYKPGQAPDQTKGSSKQLDTKSDIYTPSTKVDGSQYSDKPIDMKKVDEYNRRRRRYYD